MCHDQRRNNQVSLLCSLNLFVCSKLRIASRVVFVAVQSQHSEIAGYVQGLQSVMGIYQQQLDMIGHYVQAFNHPAPRPQARAQTGITLAGTKAYISQNMPNGLTPQEAMRIVDRESAFRT